MLSISFQCDIQSYALQNEPSKALCTWPKQQKAMGGFLPRKEIT